MQIGLEFWRSSEGEMVAVGPEQNKEQKIRGKNALELIKWINLKH